MKRMSQNFPNGGAMDTHFANMRSLFQVRSAAACGLVTRHHWACPSSTGRPGSVPKIPFPYKFIFHSRTIVSRLQIKGECQHVSTVLVKVLVSSVVDSEANTQKMVQFQKEYLPGRRVGQQSHRAQPPPQEKGGAWEQGQAPGWRRGLDERRGGWERQRQLSPASFLYLCKILDSELFELMNQNGDYTHFYFCYRWFLVDFKRGERCGLDNGARVRAVGDPSPPESVVPNPNCTLELPGEPLRNASALAPPSPRLGKRGCLGIHSFKSSFGDATGLPTVPLSRWFRGLFSNPVFSSSKA